MYDISGNGLRIICRASRTFPGGIVLSAFADDADPLDFPAQEIAGTAMSLNGDLVTWSLLTPIAPVINVIPGSEDDVNLQILWEANRVGKGKLSARDVITWVVYYPDGRQVTLTQGKITNGSAGRGVASAGRIKSRAYNFAFENRVGV